MTSEQSKEEILNDAMAYVNEIKVAFKEEREKYDCFMKILRDFKEKRIDTNDVISATMELFKGHNDLLLGFNAFLPSGYKIQLPIEGEHLSKTVVLRCECCRNFENKVKNRFEGNSPVYKSFQGIMNTFGEGKKSITDTYQEVASLLVGHTDLLNELNHFLPGASGP
ncbi:hypothetical protein RIF29_32952 [Crotalaria pallida]|uniref:Uncharacterized protein n=1 Tax=Crotalaria pallida TaxID=3830 RepID=A0AAN9ED49_CROPI